MANAIENVDLSALRIRKNPSSPGNEGHRGSGKKTVYVIATAAAVLVVVAAVLYIGGAASKESVQVATAVMTYPSHMNAVLTASGYVVADRKAAVASKGTGRLEYLGVEEGDHVTKGSVIGRLESSDVEATLGQAEANRAIARAAVDQATAELEDASANFERQKNLHEQKMISQAEYDAANARHRRAAALLASAKASVTFADAAVRSAEVAIENTYIRAPFDGVVLTKTANVGEVITPFGAAAGSRGALVTLADMSSLEVEADVSESNIEKIRPGQLCDITLDAVPTQRYRGYVHKIVPTADRAKATVMTKVRFSNRDSRVLPEMSAKILFLNDTAAQSAETSRPRLTVPMDAVATRGANRVLFVINDEVVEQREVELGELIGNSIEIRRGIAVGEKVVVRPSEKLSTGSAVVPVQ